MPLLRIICMLLSFFILSAGTGFAATDKEGGGTVKMEQTPHPPHDHHDNDHLKYIRGHGTDRKRKRASKE